MTFTPEVEIKLRQSFKQLNKFMLLMWRLGFGRWFNVWPEGFGQIMVITHTGRSLYQHVIVVDVDGREAVDISAGQKIDEGRPAWHPSGELLAVPRTATGAGKQLFLVSPDGVELAQLTDDPFFNHTALAWSPDGRYLAFMRVPRADGTEGPTVMLYDMQTGQMSEVAEGAFLPGWWP